MVSPIGKLFGGSSKAPVDTIPQSTLPENNHLQAQLDLALQEIAMLKVEILNLNNEKNLKIKQFLKRIKRYHSGIKHFHSRVWGDFSNIFGSVAHLEGDVSGLFGYTSTMFDRQKEVVIVNENGTTVTKLMKGNTVVTGLIVCSLTMPRRIKFDPYEVYLGKTREELEKLFRARVEKMESIRNGSEIYPAATIASVPMPAVWTPEESEQSLAAAYIREEAAFHQPKKGDHPILQTVISARLQTVHLERDRRVVPFSEEAVA
jgi:hypothetical protein